MLRLSYALVLAALSTGCDSAHTSPTSPLAAVGPAVVETSHSGWTVDASDGGGVRFAPEGERLDVIFDVGDLTGPLEAATTTLSLSSTFEREGRHALTVRSETDAATVQGVRRGDVVAQARIAGSEGGAGTARNTPTSVHRRIVCQYGSCSELIEYDYKLTPSGTTLWAMADDEHEVDHVRVLAPIQDDVTAAPVLLRGFETLTVLDLQ